MPALFAYLISITVFLGGAYAGLNWVASRPAEDASIQAAKVPHPQSHPKRKTEVIAAVATPSVSDPVVEAKADEKTKFAAPVVTETKPNVSEPAPKTSESQKTAESQKSAEAHKSAEARKPAERIGAPVQHVSRQNDASASNSNAAMDKPKESTSKPQKIRQVEHRRKPVMMILRTIEFADGRREQHLLPMSQSRLAEY
jgi:hypothetical protein